MATRNEFLPRNAWATRFGNLDLEPSAYALASRLLQNSPLTIVLGNFLITKLDAFVSPYHSRPKGSALDHRGDGKRYVVRVDEKLSAFVELEAAIRTSQRFAASLG